MRALKISAAAILAVIVIMAVLLMIGIPSGLMTQAIQDRVERDTGYRLAVSGATRLGIWPAPNVTLNDISVQDPKAREPDSRLTIGSVRAYIPLRRALSGSRKSATSSSASRFYMSRCGASVTRASTTPPNRRPRPATPPRMISPSIM